MVSKYLNGLLDRAKKGNKTIVLPEGEDKRILDAAHIVTEAGAVKVIILGDEAEIKAYYQEKGWNMDGITVIKPENSAKLEEYTNLLYELRKAKGMTLEEAQKWALNYNYFGTLMVKAGDADGMLSGANHSTADTVRPALQIIKSTHKDRSVSTALILVKDNDQTEMTGSGKSLLNDLCRTLLSAFSAVLAFRIIYSCKIVFNSYCTVRTGFLAFSTSDTSVSALLSGCSTRITA